MQEGVRHVAAPVAQVGGVSKRNDDGTTQSTLRALNLGLDGTLHLALPLCLREMLAVGLWDRNAETIQKSGEHMSKHLCTAAAHSLTYDLRDDPVCMRR